MTQVSLKKNLTIRLDPEMRRQLEFIAERELRTLANQITVFLTYGVREYFSNEQNNKAYNDYLMSLSTEDKQ